MGEFFFKRFSLFVLLVCSVVVFSFGVFAVVHPLYSDFSSPVSGFVFNNVTGLVSVSDTVLYKVGYYSVNGGAWQSFNLSGSYYNGDVNWLSGLSSKTIPVFGVGEHYVIVYSCTYNSSAGSWDCHDNRWQLIVINNTVDVSMGDWSSELMVNGGFETGTLAGWTSGAGTWTVGHDSTDNGLAGPQAGSYCVYNDVNAAVGNYIYQDVNLTSYASSIDGGTAVINVSGWGVSTNYNPSPAWDVTRIQFIFLNSAKSVISTPRDTGYVNNQSWWQTKLSEYAVPVNTRYIRVWGNSYENGYTLSGSLDSFSVKIRTGPCTDTCASLGYDCGSVCGVTCGSYSGGCQSGYYCSSGHCTACTTHATSSCYNGDVYWYNSCGTIEGIRYDCNSTQTCSNGLCVNIFGSSEAIIADHTIVDKYDDIPQCYIDEVKKMVIAIYGESHSAAYRTGMQLLEAQNPTYASNIGEGEDYTDQYLRVDDIGYFGESEWYTWYAYPVSSRPASWLKSHISSRNNEGIPITALGFGWCNDMITDYSSATTDPVYGVHWFGRSYGGPDGDNAWGLDAEDYSITGNRVSMETYFGAMEEYIAYCKVNSPSTKIIFTTGPVDPDFGDYSGENGYQTYIKHEAIRNYVKANSSRILFDYADILCYDDNGTITTQSWNGHTYPSITLTNAGDETIGHIGAAGALRLAKAEWWLMARIAGWDGISTTCG